MNYADSESIVIALESIAKSLEKIANSPLTVQPERSEAEGGSVHSPHSIKTISEALSYAECAVLNFYVDNSQPAMYARVIADLLADVKRQRPTGPDGKHGDRHTPTCGCDTEGGE